MRHHLAGSPKRFLGGIIFHDQDDDADSLNSSELMIPHKFTFTIRTAQYVPHRMETQTVLDYQSKDRM